MSTNDAFYYVALKRVTGLGNVTARRLLERFRTARNIFNAPMAELSSIRGVSGAVIQAIQAFDEEKEVLRTLEQAERYNVSIVCWHDEEYPKSLREIHDPPPFFFLRGNLDRRDSMSIAVVGTRDPTQYGESMTRELCKALARHGLTIVSGLARGIDGRAHEAALEQGGRTVAVSGCGLDIVYPRENAALYRSIPSNGAIISEYPIGVRPESHHFPVRNRIISGLSLGVVVVEAADRSGSLITARMASEQGREVFAVPGSLSSPKSRGTHALIQRGAKLVTRVDDILNELEHRFSPIQPESEEVEWHDFTDREMKILNLLRPDPVHFDELVRGSGMSVPEVSGCLLTLTLKGALYELSGKMYVKKIQL